MSFIGPLTASMIDTCISELKKEDNKRMIREGMIDPLINDVNRRYAPYFSCLVLLLLSIVVLLIYQIRTGTR
jgi:hypothetical protein